jgi:hypothetical protein
VENQADPPSLAASWLGRNDKARDGYRRRLLPEYLGRDLPWEHNPLFLNFVSMKRYYFDLCDGDALAPMNGMSLPDIEAAQEEAALSRPP